MSTHRQRRFAVVAVLALLIVFVMFKLASHTNVIGNVAPSTGQKTAKLILETNNSPKKGSAALKEQKDNEKKDDMINNEIGKLEGSGDAAAEKIVMVNGIPLKQNDKIAPPKGASPKGSSPNAAKKEAQRNKKDEDPEDDKDGEDYDAAAGFDEIRRLSPMVVFSKTYCGYSKRIKKLLLENYQITPAPQYVELDKHEHGAELQAYLKDITGRSLVPNALVGSSDESRGGADDFIKWHEEGVLEQKINEWGNKKVVALKINTPSNL